ncbi:MAG: hypothetical protein A3E83_04655 [Gammaproteobacteria bacterium RIFCSPHIGHO2_12_FULL_41_20]|nr:MAG: hypothetical protein A3E83_04655 [Gammaproteobacteria bacterium RIFCSPHIGHO2_12_FULL_41_20]
MYKHILFATDLLKNTDFLVEKVKKIQEYTQAKLTIIHVVEPFYPYSDMYYGVEDLEKQQLKEAQNKLDLLSKQFGIEKTNQVLKLGQIKAMILEVAEERNVDLIVCGSHGRHGIRLLLGSIANAILHGAKCDVLTVRYLEE